MGHPTWMYRLGESGQVESKLHPDYRQIPEGEGWVDTPAKLAAAKPDEARTKAAAGPRNGASIDRRSKQ